MKLFIPWVYLAAATATTVAQVGTVFAAHHGSVHRASKAASKHVVNIPVSSVLSASIDEYRQGKYFKALQAFSTQTSYNAVEAFYLGQMNLYGYGQLKNNAKAIRFYSQAGEAGFLPAQELMALYMLLEKKDPAAAFYWFKKAADANSVRGQMYVAAAYLYGFGVKQNSDKARQYYIGAAKQGNSIAQYAIAEYFLESRSSGNKTLGMLWLNKAAAQHNPKAQLLMGKLFAEGRILPKSMQNANQWVDLAVAQGYAPAMIQKGDMARAQKDYEGAKKWYTKAADSGFLLGEFAMGQLYLDKNTPMFDMKRGYLSILKAAQNDVVVAQQALSELYKTGTGIESNAELAKEWHQKAMQNSSSHAGIEVAKWLSNGKSTEFAASGYQLTGIFSDWKNAEAQKQNGYNPAPQMITLTREMLYKPDFVLTTPNEVPISDYYDAIALSLGDMAKDKLIFPSYPLDENLIALKNALDANHNKPNDQINEMINTIKLQASLGNTDAEFNLGQMYEHGWGVQSDPLEAQRNYELAAGQNDLASMYALGILYLEDKGTFKHDYVLGMDWLNKSAFKGNAYAQFVLAQIYQYGMKNQHGEVVIHTNPGQADGMYFLAAANNNGMAQYRLAEMLVRKKQDDVSITAKESRQALIKSLYESAIANGVKEASLPLAFFNAMDSNKAKQLNAFQVAKREAEQDNPHAALLLGILYDRGIGVASSPSEAMKWYEKSGSNLVSKFILGTYYSLGRNSSQDLTKGESLLQQSAEEDFSYASLNLAVLHKQQEKPFLPQLDKAVALGNAKSGLLLADYYLSLASSDAQMQQARDIYQRFAEKGDKEAQLKLAFMHEKGLGGKVDIQTAFTWYNTSAEQGQPIAQYLLGRLYQIGQLNGTPDYALAKQWYSRSQSSYSPSAVALGFIYDTVDDNYKQAKTSYDIASQLHDSVGQYNLGLIYEEGKGEVVDDEKAKLLYQQAADQGNTHAMVQLAGLYFNGKGVTGDPQLALELYKKAADKGDRDASYQLGLLSEAGVATKIDFGRALIYYEESAKLGSQQGMLAAARMYQFGIGVPKNKKQAAMYYEMLARLGNAFAQFQLAGLYDSKDISEEKSGEAKKWLQEALKNGSPEAVQAMQKLTVQSQNLSYVEPISINPATVTSGKPVELMYLDALNQWNCGDQIRSKMMFDRIRAQFPNYIPAKRTYERMSFG